MTHDISQTEKRRRKEIAEHTNICSVPWTALKSEITATEHAPSISA